MKIGTLLPLKNGNVKMEYCTENDNITFYESGVYAFELSPDDTDKLMNELKEWLKIIDYSEFGFSTLMIVESGLKDEKQLTK